MFLAMPGFVLTDIRVELTAKISMFPFKSFITIIHIIMPPFVDYVLEGCLVDIYELLM